MVAMIKSFTKISVFIFAVLLINSCTSKKQYMEVLGKSFSCEERASQLEKRLENTTGQLRQLTRENGLLETRIDQLEAEKADQRNQIMNLNSQVDDITGKAMSEQARLDRALKNKATELKNREAVLNEMRSIKEKNDAAVTDVQFKIFDAIGGFAEDDLKIEMRDGSVVISLFDKMMFDKGQTRVRSRGQEVLKALSGVLSTRPELSIMVTGHATNRGNYKNPMELSVMRASTVSSLLTETYGISTNRLTAAGRGDSEPRFDDPKHSENKRVEVIVSPRFQEIYRVLKRRG